MMKAHAAGRYARPMDASIEERYLRLGLQIDRHVEGMVDAYFGPPELASAVKAEPPVESARLVADAEALLDELDDSWLRDQIVGLRTYAGVLAGEPISYVDEAEGCYGVRPTRTDEAAFTASHEQLEELLPGPGTLANRFHSWEQATRVPAAMVEQTVSAAIETARRLTHDIADLPEGEAVTVEAVHDVPWMAFCEYLGELQSRIQVNVDLPLSALEVLTIAIHETYPGHHTERCSKERLLVEERGLLEETIVLVPTPQSLVAEGIAKVAPALLLEGESGPELEAVIHDAGIAFELAHALAVHRAHAACEWAEVNAALMLHEDGRSEAEVRDYVERWALATPEVSAHVIRFLREPTSRTYMITYLAGRELCEAYVGRDLDRFRRLLTEQVRARELVESAALSRD
jgi:hypothetical protein